LAAQCSQEIWTIATTSRFRCDELYAVRRAEIAEGIMSSDDLAAAKIITQIKKENIPAEFLENVTDSRSPGRPAPRSADVRRTS
jgi:hypothetical protein